MIEELAFASSSMKFGQLRSGDADKARKQLKRWIAQTGRVTQAAYSSKAGGPGRLKVVFVKLYGLGTFVILDTGSVPSLMSRDFCQK